MDLFMCSPLLDNLHTDLTLIPEVDMQYFFILFLFLVGSQSTNCVLCGGTKTS